MVRNQEAANDEAFVQTPRSECTPAMLDALTAVVCQQLRPLVARDVEAAAILREVARRHLAAPWLGELVSYASIARIAPLASNTVNGSLDRARLLDRLIAPFTSHGVPVDVRSLQSPTDPLC
jgi:hypothetical protein